MTPFRSLNKQEFFYPGQEIRPRGSSRAGTGAPDKEPARKALETSRTRMFVAAAMFTAVFATIGGRLVYVMAMDGLEMQTPQLARAATAKETTPAPGTVAAGPLEARPSRADIVDRNGVVLATNLPTGNLYADTRNIPPGDLQRAVQTLPQLFPDLDAKTLHARLTSGKHFIYLRRNLTPKEQQLVNDLGIPGLNFEKADRRVYPGGRLVSHVVGATDVDNNGIAGAEARFDEDLRASTEPVRLSLDLRVQHAVHRVLRESIDYFKADAGVGVVADVRTGELISMVSLPDFEPERYGDADKNAQFNRATLGVYELGSVFKVVNNAMGLDAGLTPDDGFDATHPIKISRFTINDFHGKGRWLNLTEIMTYSSNIGSAKLAMAVGAEGQQAFLRRLGLLDPLPLELPERARPLQPSIWRDVNTMTISYGHGLSVTPVHLVSAVSGLVNDGIRIPPTLLARTPDQAAPYGERVLSQEHSMALRGMMRSVVEEGSGKQADVKGYFVGGKTGSAEKESATGGYSRHDLRTSFIAAFPLDEPAYVVLVMLDSPKGLKETYNFATAGWNAAPTVGRMIAEIAPLLGVTPRPTPYPNLLDPATLNEARLETQTDNLHIATARADEGGAGVAR